MTSFEKLTQISLVALIMMGMMVTGISAQPAAGRLNESTSAQDTDSKNREARLSELLSTSLQSLSDNARRSRRIGGYMLLGLGVGSGIGGAATLVFGDGDHARIVGYSLLGGAVLFSGLSLLPFKLSSESERIYGEFSRMPSDTPDQLRQKYYYGDHRFEELARKKRRGRYIGAASSILFGVTSYFLIDESAQGRRNAIVWPMFGGVVRLLFKSDEEQRYETYQRAKEDAMAYSNTSKIRFGLALIPTGEIIGTMQMQF